MDQLDRGREIQQHESLAVAARAANVTKSNMFHAINDVKKLKGCSWSYAKGDGSKDNCEVCCDGGDLVSCDYCVCVYHGQSCLNANVEDLPNLWECRKCCGNFSKVMAEYEKRKATAKSGDSRSRGGQSSGRRGREVDGEGRVDTGEMLREKKIRKGGKKL